MKEIKLSGLFTIHLPKMNELKNYFHQRKIVLNKILDTFMILIKCLLEKQETVQYQNVLMK